MVATLVRVPVTGVISYVVVPNDGDSTEPTKALLAKDSSLATPIVHLGLELSVIGHAA